MLKISSRVPFARTMVEAMLLPIVCMCGVKPRIVIGPLESFVQEVVKSFLPGGMPSGP